MTRGLKPFTNPRLLAWTAGVVGCSVLALLAYAATGLHGSEYQAAPAVQPAWNSPAMPLAEQADYPGAQAMWPGSQPVQPASGSTNSALPWASEVTTAQYESPTNQAGYDHSVQHAGGHAENYAVMGQPSGVVPAQGIAPWSGEEDEGSYYGAGDFAPQHPAGQPGMTQPGAVQTNVQPGSAQPWPAQEQGPESTPAQGAWQGPQGDSYSSSDFMPPPPAETGGMSPAANIAATNNTPAQPTRLPWATNDEEYAPSDFAPASPGTESMENFAGTNSAPAENLAGGGAPAQQTPWVNPAGDSYNPSDFAPPPAPSEQGLPTADLAGGTQLPWQPAPSEGGPLPAQWQDPAVAPEIVHAHEWQQQGFENGPTTLPPDDPRNRIPLPGETSPRGVYMAGGQVSPPQAPVLNQPPLPLGPLPQGPSTVPPLEFPRTARQEVIHTPLPDRFPRQYAPSESMNVPQPYLRLQPGQEPVDAGAGTEAAAPTDTTPPERIGQAPEEQPREFLRDETILLDPGEYQVDITMQYQTDTSDFVLAQVVGNQLLISEAQRQQRLFLMPLELRVGLTPVVQAFVNVPFGWSNAELAFAGSEVNSNTGGLGDVSAGLTRLCIEGKDDFPTVLTSWQFSAPTGNVNIANSLSTPGSSLGEGFWSTAVGVTCINTFDPVVVYYGCGYRFRFQNEIDGFQIEPGDQAFYRLGVGVAMNPRVTLTCTFLGSYLAADEVNDITLAGGIREPMQLRLAATILRDPKHNKEASVKTLEPFVAFALTDSAVDAIIGLSMTR